MSYATWQSRFHGNPQIVGAKILLDCKPYVVIGVMPRNFEFPLAPGHLKCCELWVPMSPTPVELTQGAASWITAWWAGSNPAAVTVVLFIACANVAGLMLVRAIQRQREVALRLALGARPSALLSQTILERLALSMSGGVLGLALASVAVAAGKSLLPESLPRIDEIPFNWPLVVFALALAIVTGVLCGLAPAFAALRTDTNNSYKEGGRTGLAGGLHTRLRSAIVVGEIAIAPLLLTASGVLLRSFEKIRDVDLGYRRSHITTAANGLPQRQYSTQSSVDLFNKELLTRLRGLPPR